MLRFVNPSGNTNEELALRVRHERSSIGTLMCQVTTDVGTNSKVFNSPA